MKRFEDSDFAVIFTGECPSARIITGWDNVLTYLDEQATNGTPEESYRDPNNTGIHEPDNWTSLSCGNIYACGDERFLFEEGIGECCHVTIARITEDQLEKGAG